MGSVGVVNGGNKLESVLEDFEKTFPSLENPNSYFQSVFMGKTSVQSMILTPQVEFFEHPI